MSSFLSANIIYVLEKTHSPIKRSPLHKKLQHFLLRFTRCVLTTTLKFFLTLFNFITNHKIPSSNIISYSSVQNSHTCLIFT